MRLAAVAIPEMRGNLGELGVVRRTDSSDAVKLLGRPLIPSAEAVIATARSLVVEGVVQRP